MRDRRRGAESQCRECLTYWSADIVYCTCGHFMKDDTTENKKYISSVLDLFSIANFYIRKGRPHGHRYGKKSGCKEYHTANQLQKRCRKKKYDNIHDRFIRDKYFRKTKIELGRSEKIILEMDRLASENHSHIVTRAEIDVYRGNWWIRSNVVNFDTMPTRRQPDFKKALSTLYRLKKRRTRNTMKIGHKVPTHGGNGKLTGGTPLMRIHHKDGVSTDRTGKPVYPVHQPFICGMNLSKKEFDAKIYRDYIRNSRRSPLSPTGGVNRISPNTAIHEPMATQNYLPQVQHLDDHCGQ